MRVALRTKYPATVALAMMCTLAVPIGAVIEFLLRDGGGGRTLGSYLIVWVLMLLLCVPVGFVADLVSRSRRAK